jgi:RHS repeat-associated protein
MYPVRTKYQLPLRFLLACLLILVSLVARAGDEKYLNTLTGKILAGQTCLVQDDKYGNSIAWQKIEQDLSVKNIITFEVRYDTSIYYYNRPFTCLLKYNLEYEDRNGATKTYNNLELVVNYDTARGSLYKGVAMFKFAGGHKVKITIVSITSPQLGAEIALPAIFRVKNEIQIVRRYNFSQANNDIAQHSFNAPQNLGRQLLVNWHTDEDSYAGAEAYDLEWTFVDENSTIADRIRALNTPTNITNGNITVADAELQQWFVNNGTRVTVKEPAYTINLVYPKGFLIYRIRGVRTNLLDGEREESAWSYKSGTPGTTYSTITRLAESHQPTLNYQYNAAFAEDGKRKEGLTYFDGTLRSRQAVTLNNTDNRTSAQEDIYDAAGRPAMSFLPSPELDSTLHFFPGLNTTGSQGKIYSFQELAGDTAACAIAPEPASTATGASRYYSENNPHTNSLHTKYIPHAEGYPFAVTQFTADNTGRLRRQGGTGKTYQPGQGHDTRFFYGKPSQLELDRLFGSEAGEASHYLKNMAIDADGQIGVTYVDAHGRTIATALAGRSPDSLYALPSAQNAITPFSADLATRQNTERSTADFTVTSNSPLLIPLTGTYHFDYAYDPAVAVTSPCEDKMQDLCSDCYYDLWIAIKDECGDIKYEKKILADISGIETSCDTKLPAVKGNFDVSLPIGEYRVTYQLRASKVAAAYYDSAYLKQNTCILTLEDFKRNYLNNIDLSGCYGEAAPCEKNLGSKSLFTARFLNLMLEQDIVPIASDTVYVHALYDSLMVQCQTNTAGGTSPCADMFLQMQADLTPGGQYAVYDDAALQSNAATVFQERNINVLMKYQLITDYRDDNGQPDMVYNDAGVLKHPYELTEAEFIRNWKPSWTLSFLKYHPEYCYYIWCQASDLSRRYDARIDDIHTAQEARDAGLWDGSNPLKLLDNDVFFAAGGAGAGQYNTLRGQLNNYAQIIRNDAGLPASSVLQVIRYVVYCAKDTTVKSFNACAGPADCAAGRDEDREWEMYRTLYLQLKGPMLELARVNNANDTIRNCVNCFIGNGIVNNDAAMGDDYGQESIINSRVKTCPQDSRAPLYQNKRRLFADDLQTQSLLQHISAKSLIDLSDSIEVVNNTALADNCLKNCEAQADRWMTALKDCQNMIGPGNDSTKFKQLKAGLIDVCRKGCDISHFLGASTISPDSTNIDRSFEDVIIRVLGSGAINSNCTALLINYPAKFDNPTLEYTTVDSCTCENVSALYTQYQQNAYSTSTAGFLRWLQQKFGPSFRMTTGQLDILLNKCVRADCVNPSQLQFPIPYALTCKTCISCNDIQVHVNAFGQLYPSLTTASPKYESLLTNYLNNALKFNLSYYEYHQFLGRCQGNIGDGPMTDITCEAFTLAYDQFSRLKPNYYANPNGSIHVADSFKVHIKDWMNIVFSRQLAFTAYEQLAANCNIQLDIPHDSTAADCVGPVTPQRQIMACVPVRMDCCQLDEYLGRFKAVFPANANARLLAYYFRMQAQQWCAPTGMPVIAHDQPYSQLTAYYNNLSVPHDVIVDIVDSVATYTSSGVANCNLPANNFGEGGTGLSLQGFRLCNTPASVVYIPDSADCMRRQMEMTLINASLAYATYRDSVLKDFQDIYQSKCLALQPSLNVSGDLFEYHYTLYYYDQAGNLAKTVPPAGVKLLTPGEIAAVRQDRPFNIAECFEYTDTLNFAGNGAHIPQPSWLLNNVAQPYTIEVWVHPAAGQDQGIFSDNVPVNAPSRFIDSTYTIPAFYGEKGVSCFTRGNSLVFRYGTQAPFSFPYPVFEEVEGVAGVPLSSLLPAGKWSHVVITGAGNVKKPFTIVINGRAIPLIYQTHRDTLGGTLTELEPRQFRYGAVLTDSAWKYLKGYTKQLRIYNRVLGYAEALQNYNNTCLLPRNDAGLVMWLPMNEGSGAQLRDIVKEQDVKLAGNYNWIRHHDPVFAKHNMPSYYQYNTLGSVIKHTSPDAGEGRMWYDRTGRLVVSQNAEQRQPVNGGTVNRYSYTIYDALGRVVNFGEKGGTDISAVNTLNETALAAWMNTGARTMVTKSIYDEAIPGLPFTQSDLRQRLAGISLDENGDGTPETATYYSYDIMGRTKTMWQYQAEMQRLSNGQGLKKVDYDFDIVSGKVNKLYYQAGQADQFIYRFQYDADNRQISAYSSRDNMTWHNDVSYQYYLHGPKARIELGDHKIQGADYIYTLQGWLKGINGSALDPANEMGKDGDAGSLHSTVARDVMAYVLGYNSVDYKAIDGSASASLNGSYNTSSALSTGNGMYNGNISFTAISLNKLNGGQAAGYSYAYDQLSRLVKMQRHTITGGQSWDNNTAIEDYRENIRYDGNGNILSYLRNGTTAGGTPLAMDKLTYHYQNGTNRLTSLSDSVPAGNYPEDMDQQVDNNYAYDAIGNMIKDNAAGIQKINWTVFGKIKSIHGLNHSEYGYSADGSRIRKTSGDSTTFYLLDGTGNPLATYRSTPAGYFWNDQILYGSGRLGVWRSTGSFTGRVLYPLTATDTLSDSYLVGGRIYELTNHLGNVLSTVSDKKTGISSGGALVNYYQAETISQQDYYPFGMLQPGRQYSIGTYRYGFNGKENDNDVKGNGNQQDYGFRIYDPRIGKFLSVDPLTKSYPFYTPYQFAGNKPVKSIDIDGLEEYETKEDYKKAKGDKALAIMDGSDGAWLESDRISRNTVWSKAMEVITKNEWDHLLRDNPGPGDAPVQEQIGSAFEVVRDYYIWAQNKMDAAGSKSRWAKGAMYLVDELADTYEYKTTSGGMFPRMGRLLRDLNFGIASLAVKKFKDVLYDGEKVGNSQLDWYKWDAGFIQREQGNEVAYPVYLKYKGTRALEFLNDMSRRELLFARSKYISIHSFPDFSIFDNLIGGKKASVNDASTNFAYEYRLNIPLFMLYPSTHGTMSGIKLDNKQIKQINKANEGINSFYESAKIK